MTVAFSKSFTQFNEQNQEEEAEARSLKTKETIMAAAKPMTKGQLATHFAEKFGVSKKVAGAILDEIALVAVTQTKKVGQFTVPGIGKLVKASRKARTGRNPATGATIQIPAKTTLKFRVGKAMKDTVVPKK